MKIQKSLGLLLTGVLFLTLATGCSNTKKAQSNLLKQIKENCRQKLDTTDYYNFKTTDFSLDTDVKNLLKGYLLVNADDKEASVLSSILNSDKEGFTESINAFKTQFPKSKLIEYVEFLEEIGMDGVESRPELIPAFEKKYPHSVFIEYMDTENLSPWFDKSFYGKDGDLFLIPLKDSSSKEYNSTLEEDASGMLMIIAALAYGDIDFKSEEYKEMEKNYISSLKKLQDKQLVSSYISKYPDSKASSYLMQAQKYIEIMCMDYHEDIKAEAGYIETCAFVTRAASYLEKYKTTPLGVEALTDALNKCQKGIDAWNEKKGDGIWYITTYVDSNGKPANKKYLTNGYSTGTYKNAEGSNGTAKFRLLVDSRNEIAFQLYEGDDAVLGKNIQNDKYSFRIKTSIGAEYEISGTNYNDRIVFDAANSMILHNLLREDQILEIHITRTLSRYSTEYSFTLDTTGFAKVFSRL